MSEWEEKLNHLLADPNAMAQVMQLAQSLSDPSGGDAPPPMQPPQTPPSPPPNAASDTGDAVSVLSQLAGGLDPALLRRLLPVVRQMNRRESSETAALLTAMRPFLRETRREKVDRAVQLAKLIHLAKTFFAAREGFDV